MPQIVVGLVNELMFSTKVSAMANECGMTYLSGRLERRFNELLTGDKPALLVVDLEDQVMQERLQLTMAKWPGVRVLGFCSHVREDVIAAAESNGVFVSTKGQFDRFLAAELANALSTAV